jgi:hypothetical protein
MCDAKEPLTTNELTSNECERAMAVTPIVTEMPLRVIAYDAAGSACGASRSCLCPYPRTRDVSTKKLIWVSIWKTIVKAA